MTGTIHHLHQREPDLVLVPREPTEAMLHAAYVWSLRKYGRAIGNDDAAGCWEAMVAAAAPPPDSAA
jgi:hypothetical protein